MSSRGLTSDAYHRTDMAWRLRHSAWLLAPILGIGLLSFVGFLYCAVRVKQTKWVVLAAVSTTLSIVGFILLAAWQRADGDASPAATTYVLELWLVSVIFAVIVNRDYLTWRAMYAALRPGQLRPGQPSQLVHTGAQPQAPVAAGWYPDAQQPHLNRYWDGQIWTPYTAPRSQ